MRNPPSTLRINAGRRRTGWRDALAVVAGALIPFSFAPFDLWFLAPAALALLFLTWDGAPARCAARRGFLFGLAMFGIGVSWVYVSMHDYGFMPVPLAVTMVVLFVGFLALFPAVVGALQARMPPSTWRLALFLPALWVLGEWVRSWLLTGFPWLTLGYSQIDTPLAGIAPYLGVFGVSGAVALTAGLLAAAVRARRVLPAGAAIACLWLLAWGVGRIEWVQPIDGPLRVALVQGDIPLAIKWRPEARQAIVDLYTRLSQQQKDVALVVWPETAVPGYLDALGPQFLHTMNAGDNETARDVIFGVIERRDEAGRERIYNSVTTIGPGASGIYRKNHLVPFGEYLPLSDWLGWLLDYLRIPMSDFSAWSGKQPPIRAAGQPIGVSICYEDAFGNEVTRALPQATLLVNVSEDAWFGDSFAPYQHLQMARMRARESGRALLRATNTGITAAVDPYGRVIAAAPPFQRQVLLTQVQPMSGATPYVRFGDLPIVLLALAGVGIIAWPGRVRGTRRH